MNILYIAHYNDLSGGANLSLLALIDEIKKKGNEVYVLVPYVPGELADELERRGIGYYFIVSDWWLRKDKLGFFDKYAHLLINYLMAWNLIKTIKNLNIDVIHTNSSVINIGGIINQFTGIPHVWHIREFGKEDYNLEFCYGKKYSLNFMKKYSLKIVVISKALFNKYQSYFGSKMVLVYNGISNEYLNSEIKTDKDQFNIAISGIVTQNKGQEEAILAVNELIKSGLNQVHLYLAGNVDRDYFSKLNKMISDYNIGAHIHWVGFVKNMVEFRKFMSLELVCSKMEAFGRVTIEAMMSMNPVIGADTGANIELLNPGFNGLIYKKGDFRDLASKIRFCIENPEQLQLMGVNAYNYAISNFTAERNAENILQLYHEVLNN